MKYIKFIPNPSLAQTEIDKKFLEELHYFTTGHNSNYSFKKYLPVYNKLEEIPDQIPLKNSFSSYVGPNRRREEITHISKNFFDCVEINEQITINGLRLIE